MEITVQGFCFLLLPKVLKKTLLSLEIIEDENGSCTMILIHVYI